MNGPRPPETVLRVERGQVTEEELAAVTVALMALLAVRGEEQEPAAEPSPARWRQQDRFDGYRPPHSWR